MKNRAKKKYEQLQQYTIAVVNFADSNYRSAQNLNTNKIIYSMPDANEIKLFYNNIYKSIKMYTRENTV